MVGHQSNETLERVFFLGRIDRPQLLTRYSKRVADKVGNFFFVSYKTIGQREKRFRFQNSKQILHSDPRYFLPSKIENKNLLRTFPIPKPKYLFI